MFFIYFYAMFFMWDESIFAFSTLMVKVQMSNIDLNSLTVDELKKLSADASELIQDKEDTLIRNTYNEIKRLADSVGMSVDQIAVWGNNQARKRKQVDIKYRDPADSKNTWTGRGIQPRWLSKELKGGKKLEDFLIK